MNYSYLGIDIGKTGFMSLLTDDFCVNYPIPTISNIVDIKEFDILLKTYPNIKHCVIEDLHAVFGSSAKSTFNFGFVCGVVESLLVSNEIPYTKVNPKTWQKEMWEGVPIQYKSSTTGKTKVIDTKATSLIAAKRIFPTNSFLKSGRSKKPDHNLVDAMLLAEYCKRNF